MKLIIDSGIKTAKFGLINDEGIKIYSFPTEIIYQKTQLGIKVIDYAGLYGHTTNDSTRKEYAQYYNHERAFLDFLYLIVDRQWKLSWSEIDTVVVAKESRNDVELMFKIHPDIKCYAVDSAFASMMYLQKDIFCNDNKVIFHLYNHKTTCAVVSNGRILYSHSYTGIKCVDGDTFGRFNFTEDYPWGNIDSQVERFIKVFRRCIDVLIPEGIPGVPEGAGVNVQNAEIYVVSEEGLNPKFKSALSTEFGDKLRIIDNDEYFTISGINQMLDEPGKYNSLFEEIEYTMPSYPKKEILNQ